MSNRVCVRCGEAWSFVGDDAKIMNTMCPECTARNLRPGPGPWVDLGPEIVTHDKPAMMRVDTQGRLLCKCPACEREHTMPMFGGSVSSKELEAVWIRAMKPDCEECGGTGWSPHDDEIPCGRCVANARMAVFNRGMEYGLSVAAAPTINDEITRAIDLIERMQWEGQDYTQQSCCIDCGEEKNYGVHAKDCGTALLLRKHGRKVCFVGKP
jgi:ribosomal protein S27AE